MTRFERLNRCRCLLLPAAVCVGLLGWALSTPLIAKKVIALLVMPAGLVWLGLMVLATWQGVGRVPRGISVLVLLIYTAAGNVWIANRLMETLELPYAGMSLRVEPLEAVFVLGGGTSITPAGNAQLGSAGDRLIVAARLFLTGRTRHLVASGLSVTDLRGSRSLADDTAAIWQDFGIPESAITRLSSPRTTAEEIREFKKLMAQRGWERVGVCSSAWHLPRVELLCSKTGVTLVPIPADFHSGEVAWSPLYAVPQARGFEDVQKALWEILGAATGG